ncbi:beta-defensin 50-like [Alexandromys fortis]|uniref:beta-defensin 50-like n=1 Tax=Alexandromys fortis TaxID=100897 RepID=UPI00215272BF|nr:beta-defensin 50-like [Microtus fortis]
MRMFCLLLLILSLLSLMTKGVRSHSDTIHIRFKCIPKSAAVFGEKCPFYGKVDGICNNKGSACCMIPVKQTNI